MVKTHYIWMISQFYSQYIHYIPTTLQGEASQLQVASYTKQNIVNLW
jgi:hypothetical protein